MMRRSLLTFAALSAVALLLFASPLLAQAGGAAASTSPAVSAAKAHWANVHGYIQRAAEQLPESLYTYRPTPQVRTFAELFAHVAGSEFMFCAAARGDAPKAEDAYEGKVKDKAGLVKALRDAAAYCDVAYGMTDAASAAMVELFGQRTKMNALIFNATHDGEHYGNIVTYLRMKGLVPPSSQPNP